MGQALYRKYRSKSFSEVVGQEPITSTLSKAIKSGRISHAYLLAGPKGVGKTSVARILAHEVNNLPYTDESIHLDIIEIDAASNRRIDEIRDIREKVYIAPTSAKYKVYIIDEVHMLTKEAFNALLKTLEEPPAHCIFILATTEVHKLPETIVSRTQRFNFKPVEKDKATVHLRSIAKSEKIDIEPAALELLAEYGDGALRDSIGMLDQLSGAGKVITEQDARELLGHPPADALTQLVAAINAGNPRHALELLGKLRADGSSPALVAAQLSKKLRGEILAGTSYSWAPKFMKNLLDVSAAKQPYELLEISVLEAAQQNEETQQLLAPKEAKLPEPEASTAIDEEPLNKQIPETKTKKTNTVSDFNLALWPDVVTAVKQRAAALYTALRLAEPHLDRNVLTLGFQFSLHKNKVSEARHIKLISDIIEELCGAKVEVHCIIIDKKTRTTDKVDIAAAAPPNDKSEELTTIASIFGGAEMLES